jgi:phosphohistidine phosphatase
MELYMVRHAWAEEPGDPRWPNDHLRPLTKEGHRRFAALVGVLAKRDFTPRLIATSPMLRCVQTAELIAEVLAHKPGIVERDELLPGGDLATLLGWTSRQAGECERIAWVGHAPDVNRLVAMLIGAAGGQFRFAKGSIAALRFEDRPAIGAATLRWLVTAKVMGV